MAKTRRKATPIFMLWCFIGSLSLFMTLKKPYSSVAWGHLLENGCRCCCCCSRRCRSRRLYRRHHRRCHRSYHRSGCPNQYMLSLSWSLTSTSSSFPGARHCDAVKLIITIFSLFSWDSTRQWVSPKRPQALSSLHIMITILLSHMNFPFVLVPYHDYHFIVTYESSVAVVWISLSL